MRYVIETKKKPPNQINKQNINLITVFKVANVIKKFK